jgi:PAS domain S-box-containing protein
MSTFRRYGLAVLACGIALALALPLEAPVSCFFLAVAVTCVYGGRGPGFLSVALTALEFDYFFLPPEHHIYIAPAAYLRFAVFLGSTILIAMLIDSKRIVEEARREIAWQVRKSESYLTEAQRLSHTGSFGWSAKTGDLFWSEEAFRILGCDPEVKPSFDLLSQRLHPEDRERVTRLMLGGPQSGSHLDFEHRLLMPDGAVKHVHVLAHAATDNSCTMQYVGAVMDISDRVKAGEELRRSEAYLAEAQKLSHTASWVWNVDPPQPLYWSAELYRIYRRDPALGPVSNEERTAVQSPEDWARMLGAMQQAARDKSPMDIEYALTFPDGAVKHLRLVGHPVMNSAGEVTEIIGTSMDITEQYEANAALQKALAEVRSSEDQLRRITNTIPALVWSANPDGSANFFNERWLRYTGLLPEEALGWGWTSVIHSDDRDMLTDYWRSMLASGECGEVEARLRRRDGGYRWFLFRANPLCDEAGSVVKWFGTLSDIEDRKQAADALRASERDLSLIIETIPALVWCAGPQGDLTYVNQRVLNYTGAAPDELAQSGWLDFLHPDDVESTAQAWNVAVTTGRQHDIQYRLRRADGAYRWFHVLGQPVCDNQGRMARWYGLLIDIDDRKNIEEALRHARTRLSRATQIATVGELSASIAHEINQPLAAVVANGHACLRWLSTDPPNLAKARDAAERIVRDGKDAGEVVRRIRALFKRATLEKVVLDLNEVIEEVVSLVSGEASRKRIAIETEIQAELTAVLGDRVQLQQLLFNLITNGIEAMEEVAERPRKLIVRSRQCREKVLVEVRDYGVGLKDPDRIFEAFFTTKENGMGMGLAICRSIVEEHHGRLWAQPGDGAGTAFCFTLPVQQDGAQ